MHPWEMVEHRGSQVISYCICTVISEYGGATAWASSLSIYHIWTQHLCNCSSRVVQARAQSRRQFACDTVCDAL